MSEWEKRVDPRAERLMRGNRGLFTRLLASGTSCRQAERVLGLSPGTIGLWRCRGSYPRFGNAMRLRALLHDLSRGLDLSRVPDGFYAGAERPNLSAWIDEAVSDGWTMKEIAARSGVRPEAIRTVRRGGGISLPNGLRLARFLKLARRGTLSPERKKRKRMRARRAREWAAPAVYRSLNVDAFLAEAEKRRLERLRREAEYGEG